MILEKLGGMAFIGLAKTVGLVAVAHAPPPADELAPVPSSEIESPADDLHDAPVDYPGDVGDLSAMDRSHIVNSLHEEAVASLDLATAALADLKTELAGLGELRPLPG